MSDQAEEPTSEQKLAAMQNRGSNAAEVAKIESGGHNAAILITAANVLGEGAIALSTGGFASAACYAAPLAAGLAGVAAGAKLAKVLKLDERVLDLLGKPKIAKQGPQPATVGHAIAHSHPFGGAMWGMGLGLLAGIAAGALVATAIAGTVLSGGLLGPIFIAAGAGLAGGLIGTMVNGIGSKMATNSGIIIEGSPDVFFERNPVARVTDEVKCDKHSPPQQIAEGSETIFVNNLPLARIGHKTTCGATIQQGCDDIFGDNTTAQYAPIDSQVSVAEQYVVSAAEVILCLSAVRYRSSKAGKKVFGEPIDPFDGSYVDFRTDFEYPGIIPLTLTRTYSGKDNVEGLLGKKWICNWSQRLVYDPNEPTANLEDGDGEVLQFSLGKVPEFNSRNLKAPHYHLTGTRQNACLFDSRSQRTLVFETTETNPGIGRLTSMQDRNNNRINFIYSGANLSRVEHCDGTAFYVTTTAQGNIETIAVDESGRLQPIVQYSYSASGELTEVHGQFSGEFHYGYTKEGWLNHWHDSGATKVDLEYDSEGRVIATRTPDGMYNDRFVYFPEEKKTQYFDATGGCTSHWFNDNDLLIREQDPLGNITTHEINGLDRKLSTTDALGRTTTFDYDTFGNLTGETDWTGRTTSLAYNTQGQLIQIDYPDGTTASWKYDDNGNLVSATGLDGVTTHFAYDEQGKLLYEIGPDGATSRLEYNHHGRLVALHNALGETTSYNQDHWGRLRQVTDPAGHSTFFEYDLSPDNPRTSVSRIIHPDNGEESFAYDNEGLLKTHIAGEGQTTRYQHGAFDLLRGVSDPKGYGTQLEYDGAARLKQITNAQGQKWTYSYDLAGRLIHETDWAGRQTTYIRDAIGRVLTKRLPDGIEQHLTWDELDRIESVDTTRQRIVYEYDNSDRLTRAATFTRDSQELESDLQFSYDDKGRLTQETQNGIVIEYKYDAVGRCISRTSATGETTFSFDLLGQFTELTSNGHTLEFTRNALGLETERHYTSGLGTGNQGPGKTPLDAFLMQQSYDPCGRLSSQLAGQERSTSYPSAVHEKLAHVSRKYSWDKSGRLVGLKDHQRGASNYLYDPRDQINRITRITGINKQTEEQYNYDSLMNLGSSNGQLHQYENGVVRQIGQSSYRHDMRGRVVKKRVIKNGFRPKTWHYLWDDFDRLTETHTPDGAIWRYSYDAFGRRFRKECVKPGEFGRKHSVTYVWQGATLAEEWKTNTEGDDQPIEVSRWHFEPGTFNPIAKETRKYENESTTGQFYPIVTDHLGTPKELFDTNGNCAWQAEHSLWGETEVSFAKKSDTYQLLVDCNLRFQNQWEDKETGLYYNLNRYYDPDSGQYLSADPIGLEGGLRTHGYVHDPMQWVDPMGLAGCPKPWKEKIVMPSKPHTNKTPGHWFAMKRKAVELAKQPNIEEVSLNKGISKYAPGAKPNNRPDIMAKKTGGKIDQYEVPSKTDIRDKLLDRMDQNRDILGSKAGDINILEVGR
jgi:RHS repeat-associated protein